MRTARLLTVSRSIPCLPNPPDADPSEGKPPWMQTPDHVTCNACWESIPHSANRMTDTRKNITLPQTSFAGGKNWVLLANSYKG